MLATEAEEQKSICSFRCYPLNHYINVHKYLSNMHTCVSSGLPQARSLVIFESVKLYIYRRTYGSDISIYIERENLYITLLQLAPIILQHVGPVLGWTWASTCLTPGCSYSVCKLYMTIGSQGSLAWISTYIVSSVCAPLSLLTFVWNSPLAVIVC